MCLTGKPKSALEYFHPGATAHTIYVAHSTRSGLSPSLVISSSRSLSQSAVRSARPTCLTRLLITLLIIVATTTTTAGTIIQQQLPLLSHASAGFGMKIDPAKIEKTIQ
ncbi:unnamed protein product [Rotaria magnacalcarata]|uniref:Uncharacterized protein n=1 Tax=Rotaria magnacalcarata TaxID=392030 RepID=A0A816FWM0_9BILA|nr:unnamed protein product [Rotaria magnacalcarata]CAF2083384.1 unnamed protein product [Rotaria magnacalcarata]